jgi:hypothetical protein
MYLYSQSSGQLTKNGVALAIGYSGQPPRRNDPTAQAIEDVGPLPAGIYTIGKSFWSGMLGPVVMRLTPSTDNEMFGRSGFYIHGDSAEHAGFASNGCIVLSHEVRAQIDADSDRDLTVVA